MQGTLSASVAALEKTNARLQSELDAEREENQRLRALLEPCDEDDPAELATAIEQTRAVVDLLTDSQQVRAMRDEGDKSTVSKHG